MIYRDNNNNELIEGECFRVLHIRGHENCGYVAWEMADGTRPCVGWFGPDHGARTPAEVLMQLEARRARDGNPVFDIDSIEDTSNIKPVKPLPGSVLPTSTGEHPIFDIMDKCNAAMAERDEAIKFVEIVAASDCYDTIDPKDAKDARDWLLRIKE